MSIETPVPPPVMWAQRKEDVFLTFSIESKDPLIKIEKESVYFKGVSAQDKKTHEVTIHLYDAVNPENSAFVNKGRCIEMVLRKEKKDAAYWPSLTKDKKKPHYLKIDFNKWRDEDDEDELKEDGSNVEFEDMMRLMGNNSAGLGDKGDKFSFDVDNDSDDENLPDLE